MSLDHPIAIQPHSGIITPQMKEKKPHIKKPLNAFMLFMKEKRADVIKEEESAAINKILGKMWHTLGKSEQAKYYEKAREERARHMQMYPGWSARDNYAIHKKRKKRKVKQVVDEEDNDPNARKCKAQYGIVWCMWAMQVCTIAYYSAVVISKPESRRRPSQIGIDDFGELA